MNTQINRAADVIGILGVLVCVVAGSGRILGRYTFGAFEALTLFEIGIGIIVTACFAKLYILTHTD